MHRGVGVTCRARRVFAFAFLLSAVAAVAAAQPPAPGQPAAPPPLWTGSAGAGFSMNRGNTDTTNVNLSFEATRDPKTHSVWKFKALYLRGQNGASATVDRFLADARNERDLSRRVYAFGALQFLEDRFKQIDYLWAPAGGVGYRIVAAPMTTLNVDGGLGAKIEKDTRVDRRTDPVVTLSDKFEHKLSKTSSITQGYGALWNATDVGDVIQTFTAGVAASLTARTQMKVEFLDSYVSRPPTVEVKQNDIALLATFVYKF
jgi:putative salt-induced outer membrane protein